MIWENKSSVSENYSHELSGQKDKLLIQTKQEKHLVDLNLLLNNNWKRLGRKCRSHMTARLDPLPLVEGEAGQWQFVIGGLLSMIMLHPPKGSFFLHIKCETCNAILSKAKLNMGFKNFQIHFQTNIVTSEYWHQLYDGKLEEISAAVNKLQGAFSYNCCMQNGCLFSLILPGKQIL